MILGSVIYDQFIAGSYDAKSYLLLELKRDDSRLAKFLVREFSKKRLRININNLNEFGKCLIAYGKYSEWWLLLSDKLSPVKSYPVNIEYSLPISGGQLVVVSIRRENGKASQ
jgi:hypothetical protein